MGAANITIGPADRRWEPGEKLDVETPSKASAFVVGPLLIRVAILLKDEKDQPVIDLKSPYFDSWPKQVIDVLAETRGTTSRRR